MGTIHHSEEIKMTTVTKAERRQIRHHDLVLDVYRVEGSSEYWISKIQVEAKVSKFDGFFDQILKMLGEKPIKVMVEGDIEETEVVPVKVAVSYWVHESSQGNKKAMKLVYSILIPTLEELE